VALSLRVPLSPPFPFLPPTPWEDSRSQLSLETLSLSPGAVEVGKEVPVLPMAPFGDVKPLRTRVGWTLGQDPQCDQQATSDHSTEPASDTGQPEAKQTKSALPSTNTPRAPEGSVPEKPSEEEKGAPESGEEGLAPDGDTGKKTYKCVRAARASAGTRTW
jgi:KRAB domain-containing zinc finger protein